jgi:MarR family transcriptional regulator, organic hydroperoxide resistance regulator
VRGIIDYHGGVHEDALPTAQACSTAHDVLRTSDLNWLLHRAAQRIGEALQVAAKEHGIDMRAQLVLSALRHGSRRTQLALGASLGLDKTTLTTVLDRLERDGFVQRRPDPADRRVRIPEITDAGRDLQRKVDHDVRLVEEGLLQVLEPEQRRTLEAALRRPIGPAVPACERLFRWQSRYV